MIGNLKQLEKAIKLGRESWNQMSIQCILEVQEKLENELCSNCY